MLSFSDTSSLGRAILLSTLSLISTAGCSTTGKNPGVPRSSTDSRGPIGPIAVPGGSAEGESYGPSAPQPSPPKSPSGRIALGFGPGFARGYAASGVLRKLSELGVVVSRIYAHEGAALASAIHAVSLNENRVEWAFLKFNDAPLTRSKSLSFSLSGPEAKVMDRMREIFGARRVSALKPPIHVAEYSSGRFRFASDGEVSGVLRRALSGTDLGLKPLKDGGQEITGRGASLIDFMKEVDSREEDPLVFVAFSRLTPEEEAFLAQTGALKIQVNLHDIGEDEFKKRKIAVFRGQDAITRAKPRIYRLIDREVEPGTESTGL